MAALDAVTAEATRKAAVRRDRAKFLQRRRCVGVLYDIHSVAVVVAAIDENIYAHLVESTKYMLATIGILLRMPVHNYNDNRALVASAWRERVQKAEYDYLAAAAPAATSQHLQQKAAAGEGRRDYRSAGVVAAAPARRGGGANAKRGGAGGRGGRGGGGGSARRESGGGADVDAVACIGTEGVLPAKTLKLTSL